MGDFVEEHNTINAQLSQKIDTMENIVNKRIDGLQSEVEHKFDNLQTGINHKFDNLQKSISRLVDQHVHQKKESQVEECLSDTMVEEQCQQKLLLESSDISVVVYPWEKKEAISQLLTEEAVEEHQEHNLPLPLTDLVYILPSPASQSQPKTPAAKAKVIPPLLPIQYFKKLVAFNQTYATTSKTLAAAHTAWHSGWFGCWFRHGAPGPQQFH